MTSFTPGPWNHGNSDKPVSMVAVCFAGGTIARFAESGDISFDETMSNARLIASAPELIEALQELLKFPSGQYSEGNGFDAACLKAEAAIAKATS